MSETGGGEPVSIGHVCRLVPVGGLHEQRKWPVSTLKILTGNWGGPIKKIVYRLVHLWY